MKALMSGVAKCVACLLACSVLSGCGMSTVEREAYSLTGHLSEALVMTDKRQEVVGALVEAGLAGDVASKAAVDAWRSKVASVKQQMSEAQRDMKNDRLIAIAAAVKELDEASSALISEVEQRVSKSSQSRMAGVGELLAQEKQARAEEMASRKKYTIAAQNYNEVLDAMPTAAFVMGKTKLVGLDGASERNEKGELVGRKLVDVAIGKEAGQKN